MHKPPATLLTGSTAKMYKSAKKAWRSYILHLSPANKAMHTRTVCPGSHPSCSIPCLDTSGRGRFEGVQSGRHNKTMYFWENRKGFIAQLENELRRLQNRAIKRKEKISVRLNGTSDLAWFHWIDFAKYDRLQFYDYTKVVHFLGKGSGNYHQTFSRHAANWDDCKKALAMGYNVAVCFESIPDFYRGYPVVNGDTTDLRFLDPKGVIVGLLPKGKAKKETLGFVVRDNEV